MIRTLGIAALALALLAGCSSKEVPINVTVLTKRCGTAPGPNPTDGVDHYKIRITADDIDPIERTYAAGAVAPLQQIPPGHARTLTLYGYQGDPSGGSAVVKSWGQSLPFDVPETTSGTVQVTVVLRAVGVFAGVPTVADETACAKLQVPRAGQTATLLADGRVLIAGGFNLGSASSLPVAQGLDPSHWSYLSSYEIFDPATNTSKLGGSASITDQSKNPPYEEKVAFHTATLLKDGRVLLYGGETSGYARPNAFIYDPSSDSWTYLWVQAGTTVPELSAGTDLDRSHHLAIADSSGRVAIVGGVHYDSLGNAALTPSVLWFDPSDGGFHAVEQQPGVPVTMGLAHAAATPVLGGGGIAVAGGDSLDGGLVDPMLTFFQYSDSSKAMGIAGELGSNSDNPLRTHAASSVLGPEQRLMIIAGGTGADGSLMANTAVVDSTVASTHLSIPVGRGRNDPCAALLPDGRVLVAGGELPDHSTSPMADLYSEDSYVANGDSTSTAKVSAVKTGDLNASRFMHTCTTLKDGSVLVTGGVREEGGTLQVLDSIELYTPVPLN